MIVSDVGIALWAGQSMRLVLLAPAVLSSPREGGKLKIIALLAITIALAGCQTTQRQAMHDPPKYMTEDDLALWAAGGSVIVILGRLAWPTVVPMVALQRSSNR